MRGLLWAGVGIIFLAGLTGCGSSSSGPAAPVTAVGAVQGTLPAGVNPLDYAIYLDGAQMATAIRADGSFRLPQVPVGKHTLAVVAWSGMAAKHLTVEVRPGEDTDVGEVAPGPAGQIGGMVMKRGDEGSLTPLAGVEVLADPNVYVILAEPGVAAGEMRPSIYPPPATDPSAVQYRAVTDETGAYLIPGVAPGEYLVTVNVPGLEQGVQWVYVNPGELVAANFQLQEVVAPGVGTVQGTVYGSTSAGGQMPLEGALVTIYVQKPWEPPVPLRPLPAPPEAVARHPVLMQETTEPGTVPVIVPPPYRFEQFRTLTDKNGHWSLNVPAGRLHLSVWAEGYAPFDQLITVRSDETLTVDCRLEPWEPVEPPVPRPDQGRERAQR